VAENNNQVSNEVANNEQGGNKTGDTATNENAGQSTADNTAGSQDPIELEDYAQGGDTTDVAQAADTTEETAEEPEEPAAVETAGKTVQAENNPVLDDLSFNADDGLRWPIKGNVIMNYSMDHTIYHATLMLYKCNPAIIIDAEVGDEVKAAAKGVVTSIEEDNDETGCTVTTSIGDGYSLVYGQLDGEALDLEVGDTVDAGDAIGLIAEPTEYYTVEGSNLYFKVLENDQTVNPMSLLK
jgi:murein DD-endopeptidase MepM/ murein hydrolase activator NlpD